LNSIITTTLSVVSHRLKLGNVEVQLNLKEDLPLLLGDGSQMQQVVMNLLLNAAESTHNRNGGKVTICTSLNPSGNAIRLGIQDNGEGIPPQNIPKIYDPFFTTKDEGKGVGLGLTVVYGIVTAHGGEIEVQSKVGQGTLFTITLPLTEAPIRDQKTAEDLSETGNVA
jgi:signal transduction histidine kinase